ncbi:hypothetical protein REG_1745 [Candidatus Regiella insecticola LSR1]|uniref:Uncharacterized protein n=1 Tax=Candidatus Regiella insecticola LSR1 TaxID=663321 RepID=E0WUG4_9ENTR|nr:hypothetical protein [Candidatus Regiella insecticola]EFL91352.1 hypothetical protein REG_1745 [Candidatus Regiella insecticola LSR1]
MGIEMLTNYKHVSQPDTLGNVSQLDGASEFSENVKEVKNSQTRFSFWECIEKAKVILEKWAMSDIEHWYSPNAVISIKGTVGWSHLNQSSDKKKVHLPRTTSKKIIKHKHPRYPWAKGMKARGMKSTRHIIIQSQKKPDRLNDYQQPYRPELTPSSDANDANEAQTPDSNPFYENFFPVERNPFNPRYRLPELNPSSNEKEDLQLKRHMHLGLEGKENFRHMYSEESTSYPRGKNKPLEKNPSEKTGGLWQRIKGPLFIFLNLFNNISIFGA